MRHFNRSICIAALLVTALNSEAVQLGAVKGSAVFGRPLDLTIQVRLDTPLDEGANCFSADVFQADIKFDAGRVRLDVTPAANGLDATIRVNSVTPVSEPWAKVILRSNCGAKVSRQYNFLTDFAAEIPAGNMLAETMPVLPTTNAASSATAAKSSPEIAQAPVSNWSVKRSQAKAKASLQKPNTQIAQIPLTPKKINPITPATAVAAIGAQKTTEMVADTQGQSRLKMETFELTDEYQILLKLSTALVAPTGMRTPEEIQALAQATAVWRAINGMPAEVKATETQAADVIAASQIKAPPVTIPTLMNQKLTGKSEFSNMLVYGLIGLLALTLACIAWLWLRVREASRAGYGWLNDSVTNGAVVVHAPTQFLHSDFYGTETVAQTALEPSFETETERNAKTERKAETKEIFTKAVKDESLQAATFSAGVQTETSLSSSPLASLVSHSNDSKPFHESTQKLDLKTEQPVAKATGKAVANKQTSSPMPSHFDDSRFDERVMRVERKNQDAFHEQPITSSAELIDLVLADTPPKWRAVTTPVPEPVNKPSAATTNKAAISKTAVTNEDSKNNLIDFDVFAEPEPLNKPTRFVRQSLR